MNGLVSEYWAGFSADCFSDSSGDADVGQGAARAVWKHWRREARAASDDGGGITQLADWCKTSCTSFQLCSWICFWISHSICSLNCWLRPSRGVSSTLLLMWRQLPHPAPEPWSPTWPPWHGPPVCRDWYHSSLHGTPGNVFWEGSGWEPNPAPIQTPPVPGIR